MKLEAAIKIFKETQDSYLKDELDLAIETVLQALENSIPKKKIKDKIEYLENLRKKAEKQNNYATSEKEKYKYGDLAVKLLHQANILQELLEE